MSISFGFYNSLNGDRKYNAIDFGSIFDGIIVDGVYMTIGEQFMVTTVEELTVNVGTGRAWFRNTWTLNDARLPIILPPADLLLPRIDAIILEVNSTEAVRANTIKIVSGIAQAVPARPTLISNALIRQVPLCYIFRSANQQEITQSDITNMVGTSECPFVTSPLEGINADALLAQWETQWEEWQTANDEDAQQIFAALQEQIARIQAGTEVMLKTEYAPDTTAEMVDGVLTVNSTYTSPTSRYPVEIDIPEGYEAAEQFVLDGDMVTVTGIDMEPTELDAAPGAVVSLVRRGDFVFPRSGGGGGLDGLKVIAAADESTLPPAKDGLFALMGAQYYVSDVWVDFDIPVDTVLPGTVFIQYVPRSDTKIRYFSKKNIYNCVGMVLWYNGSEWVSPPVMKASEGAWIDYALPLFKNGVWGVPTKVPDTFIPTQTGTTTMNVIEENGRIVLGFWATPNTNTAYVGFVTANKIDLTNTTTVRVRLLIGSASGSTTGMGTGPGGRLVVCNNQDIKTGPVVSTSINAPGVYSLNVNSLTGSYYIGLYTNHTVNGNGNIWGWFNEWELI